MPASIKAVRCTGCGAKVLEATCNSAGRCVACALDEIERDETLDRMLAEIANDTSLDDALAELSEDDTPSSRADEFTKGEAVQQDEEGDSERKRK